MMDANGAFESEQIGSFFSFAKASDEFGVSLIGEARIPKRNPRLCETIMRMYQAGTLSFSFEILASEIAETDGMLVIDAAEGNELIGMAVVSTPAYPEATALKLVAEQENQKEEPETMDENLKRIAELEAKLKLAEEQAKDKDKEDELKKKDDEIEEANARKKKCEEELAEAQRKLAEKDTALAERDTQIAELDAQIAELTPFKAEVETLKAEKAAAELAARQQELAAFAEAQGLDVAAEPITAAIKAVDCAALIAEVAKQGKKNAAKPTVASYAMSGGMSVKGEYGDLLDKA